VIEVILVVQQYELCAYSLDFSVKYDCFPVTRGKQSTPTPLGPFPIQSITPTSDYLSPWVIQFHQEQDNIFAIHSWNNVIPIGEFSNGCVRLNPEDLDNLISNYLFSAVLIKP